MAASNEWFEYHLTPRGWEMGINKTDSGRSERKDPPADHVLTVLIEEYMSSVFSPMECSESVEFKSTDSELVAKLVERFGSSPSKSITPP